MTTSGRNRSFTWSSNRSPQHSLLVKFARAAAIFIALLVAGCSDICGNELLTQHESPSGDLSVVVFQRDCGATTGYTVQGSILGSDEELKNEPGNLFVIGENAVGRPSVDWIDDRKLKLSYSSSLDIRIVAAAPHGVTITVNDAG